MNLRASGATLPLALALSTLPARAASPAATYADKLLSSVYPAGQPGAAHPLHQPQESRGSRVPPV